MAAGTAGAPSESPMDTHWHLDKRVNVGHLLTTATVLAGVMWWGSTVESRVAVLESRAGQSEQTNKEVKAELIRLNDKMDRLLAALYQNGGGRSGATDGR